jgi:hypothetical protein
MVNCHKDLSQIISYMLISVNDFQISIGVKYKRLYKNVNYCIHLREVSAEMCFK